MEITIVIVVVVIAVIISLFTNAVMTDKQKNDNTPVFYRDENGNMQQTTQADMTRQQIGNGCLWALGSILSAFFKK